MKDIFLLFNCPSIVLSLGKSFAQEIKTYPDNE